MAQHGYLHDTYDNDDFGRSEDREQGSWRGDERERGSWRGDERGWRDDRHNQWEERDHRDEQGRGFMFDEREHGRSREHSAFSSPSARYARGLHRDDDRQRGRDQWQGSGDRFSASTDHHYRSWRDRQMEALDRDYEDYCREREQQFHQDFDSWRRGRENRGGTGRSQSQQGRTSEEVMDLDNPMIEGSGEIEGGTTSPMATATLGTNDSENTAPAPTATGRGRR
jgi:hypothetical protein